MSEDEKLSNEMRIHGVCENESTALVPQRAKARTSRGARERAAEDMEPSLTMSSTSAGYVLQCHGHGVDSLYISHRGRIKETYEIALTDLKAAAKSEELADSNQAQLQLTALQAQQPTRRP